MPRFTVPDSSSPDSGSAETSFYDPQDPAALDSFASTESGLLGGLSLFHLDSPDAVTPTEPSPEPVAMDSNMANNNAQPTMEQILAQLNDMNQRLIQSETRAQAAEQRAVQAEARIAQMAAPPAPPPPQPATLVAAEPAKRPKPRLPELYKFSGKRADYRAWSLEARDKLSTDGESIGNERHRFQYIFARMEPDAKNLVAVYYEQNRNKPDVEAESFMKHLDGMFIDPNAANRALSKLTVMSQRKDSFATFLPKFERALAESLVMEDRARIAYLHQSLCDSLKLALVSRDLPDEYGDYVTAVAKVASALEQCHYTTRRAHPPFAAAPATTPQDPDAMDWTSTPVTGAALKPLTDTERNYLRNNNGCFRCRQINAGHISRNCPRGQVPTRSANVPSPTTPVAKDDMSENGEL